jgi:hypothetical protein
MIAPAIRRALLAALLALTACSKPPPASDSTPPQHRHHAPHGGTPVVLGAELYHLELVLDPAAGRLDAYVLDGEMENFVRIAAPSFEVVALVAGAPQPLHFTAVASTATGETVGDTAQFGAQADWLKTTHAFDATLTRLEIRGAVFAGVQFNFPKGNDTD